MKTIAVVNPKGGAGKTTLALQVAGWLAGKRQRVVLADLDRQRSATHWLARRPPLFPEIHAWTPDQDRRGLKELDPQYMVVDTPAGLYGEALREVVRRADVILVPVTPSVFDMDATRELLAALREYKSVREGEVHIGLVGNRVHTRFLSAAELDEFLRGLGFPFLADLRDTQVYIHCARDGLTIFDLPPSRGEQDREQWKPITRWLAKKLA